MKKTLKLSKERVRVITSQLAGVSGGTLTGVTVAINGQLVDNVQSMLIASCQCTGERQSKEAMCTV